MVSGSRQRNSISRVAPGTRSRTQIIVGTSSTTMPTTVSRASSSDVVIASVMVGSWKSACQAAPVRSLVIGSLVLKFSSARSGIAKKAPNAMQQEPAQRAATRA